MSDEKKIPPALSREQWRALAAADVWQFDTANVRELSATGIAANIALANAALPDDSLYKITREAVDRLGCVAAEIRRGLSYPPDAVDLERLAAKLAALLPPR